MSVAYEKPVLALADPLLMSFSANAQSWRQVGTLGEAVQSLAAVPCNPQALFLGAPMGMCVVRRTGEEH